MAEHVRALAGFQQARAALVAAPQEKSRLQQAAHQRRAAREALLRLPVHPHLSVNQDVLRALLDVSADATFRELHLGGRLPAAVIALNGLVEMEHLEKHVLRPLMLEVELPPDLEVSHLPALLRQEALPLQGASTAMVYGECLDAIFRGHAILLVEGVDRALLLDVVGFKHRAVEEPVAEMSIRGPREGFTESLQINTSLLRRRIRSSDLKFEQLVLGRVTRTPVLLCYVEGVVNPTLLQEVRNRISRIDVDGIIDTGYIEEFIEETPWSPFPQVQNTERPDTVAANLLEGRVCILAEGTPFALLVPTTFWSLMQASEDYYERYTIGTALRFLRYIFLLIALTAPSLYIAVTTFHPEMMPEAFLLTIAAAREGIPFPAFVEALIMEVFFEALREAGVRLPRPVGQAVSIVGALVIGEAAVRAGLASAPIVIVVAATGIASFTIPRFNLGIAIRILRFPLIFLAGSLGLFGVVIGLAVILIHLAGLRSFGVPYLQPIAPITVTDWKDVLVRAPAWLMGRTPATIDSPNERTQAPYLMPSPRGPGGIWRRKGRGGRR